jgi:hypothetical protein
MNKIKTVALVVWQNGRNLFGRVLMACGALMAIIVTTSVCRADDISDTTSAVSGYVTAAIAVGVSVILFVLGRRVLRRLIALAFIATSAAMALTMSTAAAHATGDDISTVTSSVSSYVTAAIAVGVSVILFVLGRRVLKRLI